MLDFINSLVSHVLLTLLYKQKWTKIAKVKRDKCLLTIDQNKRVRHYIWWLESSSAVELTTDYKNLVKYQR